MFLSIFTIIIVIIYIIYIIYTIYNKYNSYLSIVNRKISGYLVFIISVNFSAFIILSIFRISAHSCIKSLLFLTIK